MCVRGMHVCVAVCEKVGNSWECGCWKELIVCIHVYDCVSCEDMSVTVF